MHQHPAARTARSAPTLIPALALGLGVFALASGAQGAKTLDGKTHTGVALTGTLDGHGEVPKGDPKGSGEFVLWVDAAKQQACYDLGVAGIGTPTAAHVHKGAAGVAGPPVIMLQTPTTLHAAACAPVTPDLAADLVAHPADYYVNVHTAAFPGGAIRAQLMRK
ncbi:MAG: CHRD domain-containing protein [Novosphingobium sp.]|nr:CHRD domain-containing protein [Novosphingobium sp.]